MNDYKLCQRCIMDTTSDPHLILDDDGVCNYCHAYDKSVEEHGYKGKESEQELEALFDKIKEKGKGKEYDCLLGISGGVDSSYLAYLAKQYDLRVLAVHVDAGWNSELAVQNIKNMCQKLGYDLHTVVVDWPTMKELQRAYMFSGLANLDVPQDHCFIAACAKMAKKFGIKYILNGNNWATEGILSTAYQHSARDWRNIKGVYKRCGRAKGNLSKYPHQNFIEMYLWDPVFHHVKFVFPLNYINYSKKMAIATLEKEFDWKYYGGKHYESRFTKFFQEIYLPKKFGWDKRRDHISSLIVGGEMTREEGLKEIAIMPSTEAELEEEKEYVLKKLDITDEEWNYIMEMPVKSEDEYPNDKKWVAFCMKIKNMFCKKR